ncbi:MAG: GTP cyclohydrolase I FolE [Vallitaleaceae bacterium]|jgi:GTP cyclohydrolase IA|nr:GTP cyclohydrolase I FolE [Vallitaleaceae bacterium]
MIDKKAIEEHIKGILIALGDDPNREGLIDTPKRVASMYAEVFEGMNYSNDEIVAMLDKTFEEDLDLMEDSKDMVLMKDIEIFSFCEHHIALMYNMKVTVAYLPNGKVIGLSKMARIADLVSKRLQLQERIGSDIAYIMQKITESEDVAVIIQGEHSCMSTRGIRKTQAKTITTTLKGRFQSDDHLYTKLMTLHRS